VRTLQADSEIKYFTENGDGHIGRRRHIGDAAFNVTSKRHALRLAVSHQLQLLAGQASDVIFRL